MKFANILVAAAIAFSPVLAHAADVAATANAPVATTTTKVETKTMETKKAVHHAGKHHKAGKKSMKKVEAKTTTETKAQ